MSTADVLDPSATERLRRLGGDKLVVRVIESYLANGADRLAALRDGAAAGDAARVERAAHTLKSSAGNVGATRLQYACAALEAQAHDGAVPEEIIGQVEQEHERAVIELRRIQEELTA